MITAFGALPLIAKTAIQIEASDAPRESGGPSELTQLS
jgi:hypothetical protein